MSTQIYKHSRRDIRTGRYIKRRILPVLIECGCDCGRLILSQDSSGKWRSYLRGHVRRAQSKGQYLNTGGYKMIRVRDYPKARKNNGWIYEHVYVMEKHLGRELVGTEEVHHINMIKTDNRIENLALFPSSSAHKKYHAELDKQKKDTY